MPFPRGIRGPPGRRPRLERRGCPPACTGAAPPAPRIARTADQRPPLPRDVAPRRPAAPRARLQRRPARRAPAAAEPPVGLRQGRRPRPRHRPRRRAGRTACPARPGATGAARWFAEQLAPYGYQVRQEHFTADVRGPRPRPPRQPARVPARPLAEDDPPDGAPRRLRQRRRGERQRLGDGRAARARPRLRTHGGNDPRPAAVLASPSSRRTARSTAGSAPRGSRHMPPRCRT